MTQVRSPARLSILSCTLALLCTGFVSGLAQDMPARGTRMKSTAKRFGDRRLVKIRARAGDTIALLADRFGIPAEELAELNGVVVGAYLQAGRELMIPLPSPEAIARASAAKLAQHDGSPSSAGDDASEEGKDVWENVQGVLFRRGSTTRVRDSIEEKPQKAESENKKSDAEQLATIVEVSDAARSNVAQPVWIYLIGGARIEADSVNETNEGVWYKRGNLSIFIERSRIERIEREREQSKSDTSESWSERGWSTGNSKIDALIKDNGARFGVDPYLIFCVMEQESQFKSRVVSPKGARGLMQLMPGTAAHFGVRRPFDPADNIMGGTRYLKQLLQNFGGRVDLVLAGYNAGEGAVLKFGGNVPPYRETRNYVQRISKRYGQSKSHIAPAADHASPATGLR